MDRPTKVEVGQRWLWCKTQERRRVCWTWTIVEPHKDGWWPARDQYGSRGHLSAAMCADDKNARFLGYAPGYGPQEAKAHVAVGQTWRWTKKGDEQERHFRIIGESVQYAGHVDGPSFVIEYASGELGTQTVGSIQRGCYLIAPAAPKVEEPAPTVMREPPLGPGSVVPGRAEVAGSPTGAFLTRVGDVTALQLIKARKPPAPYIPTIDEWDLLPDA